MKIMMKKFGPGENSVTQFAPYLVPHGKAAEKAMEDLKNNVIYSVEVKKARNPLHHNLIFLLAQIAVEHAPEGSVWEGKDAYAFIKAIELEAGIVDYITKLNGETHVVPRSIAFENMDEIEFNRISDLVFRTVAKILGINEEYLRKNYQEM
jgi:hypothetical protein